MHNSTHITPCAFRCTMTCPPGADTEGNVVPRIAAPADVASIRFPKAPFRLITAQKSVQAVSSFKTFVIRDDHASLCSNPIAFMKIDCFCMVGTFSQAFWAFFAAATAS